MKTAIGEFDMVTRKPRADFDAGLEIIVKDVLQLTLEDPIPLAINHHTGVSTWQIFMYLDEDDVDEATYLDANGSIKPLTKFEQKLLRWMVGYVRENVDAHKPGSDMPAFYTKDGFTQYTQNRRKLEQMKERYTSTRNDGEKGRKTLEEHILDIASKVKKTTCEILAKHKERMQKEQTHAQDENKENKPAKKNEA